MNVLDAVRNLELVEFERLGDRIRAADAMRLEGAAMTGLRHFDSARVLLDGALDRSREIGALLNVAETLRARAALEAALGNVDAAREDARSAIAAYRTLGATKDAESVSLWLATQVRTT